jgi:TolB protein
MNSKMAGRNLCAIVLLVLLVLLASPAAAAEAYEDAPGSNVLAVPVFGPLPWVWPIDIDETRVVWVEAEGDHMGNSSVHVCNLTTGEERTVSESPQETAYCSGRRAVTPGISGDLVVWTESIGTSISIFNLTSGEERALLRGEVFRGRNVARDDGSQRTVWEAVAYEGPVYLSGPEDLQGWDTIHGEVSFDFPAVDGDRIVWEEGTGTDRDSSDIYLYNLTSGELVPVCTAPGEQTRPKISGDRVVWQDMRNGNWDIYCYDLTTGEEQAICTDPARQIHPDIDGDDIVWQDRRNAYLGRDWDNSDDIYHFDLDAGTERALATGREEQQSPAVDDGRVVWVESVKWKDDPLHEGNRLLVHDLATGSTRCIPAEDGIFKDPVISGSHVAFCVIRDIGESWSVSVFALEEERPDRASAAPTAAAEPVPTAAPGYAALPAIAALAAHACRRRKG